MGKLRVYGDSFSVDLKLEWQYVHQLSRYLNKPIEDYSLFGCSNEWIVKNILYDLIYNKIEPDDFILVVTTSETRNWLFPAFPDIGNFNGISDLNETLTPSQQSALKTFVTHFYNDDSNIQRHMANNSIIKNLLTAARDRYGVNSLVLPGFFNPKMSDESARWLHDYVYPNNDVVIGTLNDHVCFAEFEEVKTIPKIWYKTYNLPDIRANHMLKRNHDVLFEKIKQWLTTGETIDLTTGFHQKVINKQRLHQYWSYRGETIDMEEWHGKAKMGITEEERTNRLLDRLVHLEKEQQPFLRSLMH